MENFEVNYLKNVQKVLDECLTEVNEKIQDEKILLEESSQYFIDNYVNVTNQDVTVDSVMDNQRVNARVENLIRHESRKEKIIKQKNSPYFGRIDFAEGNNESHPYYIGLAHIAERNNILVCDWRAPLSSMYYDFGLGKAEYEAEGGKYFGEITKKRQYRIESGELKYMIESDQTINDDVLEYCLSQSATAKMKEIAATIQSDQNKIIRRELEGNIIVQGVAGSGKTSVALHRAAYLLYKHKESIKNKDILILSPSNAFSNYISNVLPSLGENNLAEMTFDELARQALKLKVETKDEQLSRISKMTQEELDILNYKGSFKFLEALEKYMSETVTNSFAPQDMTPFGITKEELKNIYLTKGVDIKSRLNEVVKYIFNKLKLPSHKKMEPLKRRITEVVYRMLPSSDAEVIYKHFLASEGILSEKELEIALSKNGFVLSEDAAPILYIYKQLYNFEYGQPVKYLIVDEMQEYSPVHFKILGSMFLCSKFLVGDINQCMDKALDKVYLEKLSSFFDAETFSLEKSYRSTREIQRAADKIVGVVGDLSFSRHGEEVKFITVSNLLSKTKELMKEYSKYNRIAIITKTTEEAQELYDKLKAPDVELLIGRGSVEGKKYLILPVALAKGLEFEAVIVYNSNSEMYKTSLDAKMLYVAATRAIHALTFMWKGDPSNFVHSA